MAELPFKLKISAYCIRNDILFDCLDDRIFSKSIPGEVSDYYLFIGLFDKDYIENDLGGTKLFSSSFL